MRALSLLGSSALLLVSISVPLTAQGNDAQRLYEQARYLFNAADWTQRPKTRLASLKGAQSQLQEIVLHHPNNPLAARIARGEGLAGRIDAAIAEIETSIAELHTDALACASALDVPCVLDLAERVGTSSELAAAYARHKDVEPAEALLEAIENRMIADVVRRKLPLCAALPPSCETRPA